MLAPNTILQNRYRILRKLGAGGVGAVYLAVDQRLNSEVAIKEVLLQEDAVRRAFEREASLLANLHHPALPVVIDHFLDQSGQFLVMQYVPGDDLSQELKKRGTPFPASQVLDWGDELLDALSYLHSNRPPIVHRDIKPSNLKIGRRGQLVLLDFGLAKGWAGQMTTLTNTGSVFGFTPCYAPLEQITGEGTDPRSDIYSAGTTLYHLMTGVTPVTAAARYSAFDQDEEDPLTASDKVKGITTEASHFLAKSMAIRRKDRFASADEMRNALRALRRPAGEESRVLSATDHEETLLSNRTHTAPFQQTHQEPSDSTPAGPRTDLVRLINSIGKATFVKYYRHFENRSLSNQDVIALLPREYTLEARRSRTSSARRIFREGRQREALEIIARAKGVDDQTRSRARNLLAELSNQASVSVSTDKEALSQVIKEANRRQFWIVLWGDPQHSADEDAQVFDQPIYDQGLARKPESMRLGDILFVHRIHISKIIFVGEIIDAPRKSTSEEIEKESWRKRWTWSVQLKNLTPTYGLHWRESAQRTFALKDQYNELNPHDQVNLGRLQHGMYVKISEGFARFLLNEIIGID